MPLYDYRCQQCQTIFEVRASFQEKEAGLEPECPECHSQNAQQLLTAGMFLRAGDGEISPGVSACCGPNAGPGCCG